MKKILIALDYNPSAQKIAETGHNLAKAMKARTILLHVTSDATYYSSLNYSPIMGYGGFNNVVETDNAKELKKAAQDFLDKSKQHLRDEKIQTVVKNGVIGETILKTATDLKVDIIVMGTHSRRGLEKILVGSVAENVLHHSSIPLLIIPTKGLE
ncbi:MAG TPA: universal stress protein [Chitinophagaceae bacterium]|nr:universal stress protein [Chitinophagaceae bacterium]